MITISILTLTIYSIGFLLVSLVHLTHEKGINHDYTIHTAKFVTRTSRAF